MNISVVIPLYNEDESLPPLIEWIHKVMMENQFTYEVVFVDDGSRDKSWSVIEALAQDYPAVRGIRFQRNYGKSAALQKGFETAEGEVIITMDADLQDSPDEIPELYRLIVEEGYDLISGWKKKRYDPISKTIPSKFFNYITRVVSGIKLNDFNCGLKSYRKDVVKAIEVYGEMHRYVPLLAKWAGFDNIGEKEVEHRARQYGKSKFGLNRFINGFLDLISIVVVQKYLKKPMHFFGAWGMVFTLIGAADLLYLAAVKILDGELGNRLPAIAFGSVMFISGILLFSTGLLAELIGRNSPYKNQYTIKERLENGETFAEKVPG
ncbi:MAG: glycosyltransferase family 2 protein [Bacteroidota bacterium]